MKGTFMGGGQRLVYGPRLEGGATPPAAGPGGCLPRGDLQHPGAPGEAPGSAEADTAWAVDLRVFLFINVLGVRKIF